MLFEKPQPGYVVRKIHQKSEFPVGLVIKFHYQPQNDVKRLDDFHLIKRNSIIWLNSKEYCSIWHVDHKIHFCSIILIYNMRPENWYVAYFKGFEIQNLGTIEFFWMKSILTNTFSKCFLGQKKFDLIKFYKDLFLQKEMVPSPKTFDA